MNSQTSAFQVFIRRLARVALAVMVTVVVLFDAGSLSSVQANSWIDIHGPAGSGTFGTVTMLPNGNFVVVDPLYTAPGPIISVGAVYLYNGATGARISMLTGSSIGDKVGEGGVIVLSNGNYVVVSYSWNNLAGAVTWGSSGTGVSGVVSEENSLVGSPGDHVGSASSGGFGYVFYRAGVIPLKNGNYVVVSPHWRAGANPNAGAVTWGNGMTGIHGPVSAANSLVGSSSGDSLGGSIEGGLLDGSSDGGVTALSNGNYVVRSPNWDLGAIMDAGAVTWGDGTKGVTGVISEANSLIGSSRSDYVGAGNPNFNHGVVALANGNYVVLSPYWENGQIDAGAVTWGDGTSGVSGVISAANSLVGDSSSDEVGVGSLVQLAGGNYVVVSYIWRNEMGVIFGAVTWGNGETGTRGLVSEANSLVGFYSGDFNIFSYFNVTALTNGNYVVDNPYWNNGAGIVTWGNGETGTAGVVTVTNSLVGSVAGEGVGKGGVTALTNGNYVVSTSWEGLGATTWGNGQTGISGIVSAANSLLGSAGGVSNNPVIALKNGNYVVRSPNWDNGTLVDVGAATWGDGQTGLRGFVTGANSLVGSTAGDKIGDGGVMALSNGNYAVMSPGWNLGKGAVTWGNGTTGNVGVVTAANSLVGSMAGDRIGGNGVVALANGNYVVVNPGWHNDAAEDSGAVTWGDGTMGTIGVISGANSLVGSMLGVNTAYPSPQTTVTELNDSNYAVVSPFFYQGALTFGSATTGVRGAVSPGNSLVGGPGDLIGQHLDLFNHQYISYLTALKDGNYVVKSPDWNKGAGAVSLLAAGDCAAGLRVGSLTSANSVFGVAKNGLDINYSYDPVQHQIVVGRPADNIVTLLKVNDCAHRIFLPFVSKQ